MGTLVVGGKEIKTWFDTVNYLDDPKCKLGPRSCRKRGTDEQKGLCGIIVHTTGGIPGGKDLRPQLLKAGAGPNTKAGSKYAQMWQTDLSKFGGAHLVVDFDGKVYQCCDLLLDAAYHAELANGRSIGIEVCQNRADAGLYEAQIEANVKLVSWLTAQFGIQRQICALPYEGKPVTCLAGKLTRYGVFGHRNLTSRRGSGDPGDYLLQALSDAGYEEFDFDAEEDLETWKNRQGSLGVKADGMPGPATVAALKEAGYHNGIWVPDAT
jgi:hypothetical protein